MVLVQGLVLLLLTVLVFYLIYKKAQPVTLQMQQLNVNTVICVKDAESYLEWLIASIKENSVFYGHIWVIDLGSKDKTPELLERLKCDYPMLHTISPNEFHILIEDVLNGATNPS